ncbi:MULTISPECIES: hypothetical protein [Chryseobacterium]|uniref:Uncharacterized protein n=1 Tax=Chryseobacterium caseinilyticum TaxID=2771428 RepID=A0ABR8ZA07_9FLAO|nr:MULTISPECIES: hypothetical protein [Chryseobacterium]KQS92665.1 hypothetical protein ASG21_09570 [Chryseobacterium sp. Leaf394]MBD8081775.1 hypothetical protein [Chryseobacterium caseinilyticum]
MNITDLKITNLVKYNNQIYSVKEILQPNEGQYFVKIDNDLESFTVPAENIKPILIDEDWLQKLGFSKTYSSEQRIRYERPEQFIKYDFDLTAKKLLEGLKIYGNSVRCRYIHEVQNIFSSLIGKPIFNSIKKENTAIV